MREYQYTIRYIKGKKNVVAESLPRPILVIQPSSEAMWLGKSREEIKTLQREKERWKDLMDYLEGGKVPNKIYKPTTLDQFTLWEDSGIIPSPTKMATFVFA